MIKIFVAVKAAKQQHKIIFDNNKAA